MSVFECAVYTTNDTDDPSCTVWTQPSYVLPLQAAPLFRAQPSAPLFSTAPQVVISLWLHPPPPPLRTRHLSSSFVRRKGMTLAGWLAGRQTGLLANRLARKLERFST